MFGCSCWVVSWCWCWMPRFSRLAGLVYSCDPHQCCLCATCTTSTGLRGAQSEGPGVVLPQRLSYQAKSSRTWSTFWHSLPLFFSFIVHLQRWGLKWLNISEGWCREECRSQRIPHTNSQQHVMQTSASSTLIGWSKPASQTSLKDCVCPHAASRNVFQPYIFIQT